jgi:hypothetical protein
MDDKTSRTATAQVPARGMHNLDHVAYFVPERAAMHAALVRLGFAPTPFSLQQHRLRPDADLAPAGTGNHCVMLQEGYLEFLVPVAETPVAAQLRLSIDRYVGAHSIVFGTQDAAADAARLAAEGFDPLPAIALQRTIDTPDGERTARFTVLRVPPGTMAEGRIQYCRHHTPAFVWQARWLAHPNHAVGLAGVSVCVRDVAEAAARYGRFTGIAPRLEPGEARIVTSRGQVRLVDAARGAELFGVAPPALPWIAACEIVSSDLAATRRCLEGNGLNVTVLDEARLRCHAPAAIGGAFVFRAAQAQA